MPHFHLSSPGADLDNDGDLDQVFAGDNGTHLNDGSGDFSDGPTVPVTGIDDPRAIAFADIENDGDVDFAVGVKRSRNWLVRNDYSGGNNLLKVELISPAGQAGAFGARICVHPAGARGNKPLLGFREAGSNYGYLGQDDPIFHAGLGRHRFVDVSVTFLDGSVVNVAGVSANEIVFFDGPRVKRQER